MLTSLLAVTLDPTRGHVDVRTMSRMGTSTKSRTAEERNYPSRRELRYLERKNKQRNRWIIGISAVLIVGLAIGIFALASGSADTATTTTVFNGTTIDVVLGDYVIQGNLTAPAGNIRIQALNQGGMIHNVGIKGGPISGDMLPGKGFTLDVGSLAPGTYQLYCDIPGHVEHGMTATLVIT
jgi:uncharacterized cupredoxin-like copper-binding protein